MPFLSETYYMGVMAAVMMAKVKVLAQLFRMLQIKINKP